MQVDAIIYGPQSVDAVAYIEETQNSRASASLKWACPSADNGFCFPTIGEQNALPPQDNLHPDFGQASCWPQNREAVSRCRVDATCVLSAGQKMAWTASGKKREKPSAAYAASETPHK